MSNNVLLDNYLNQKKRMRFEVPFVYGVSFASLLVSAAWIGFWWLTSTSDYSSFGDPVAIIAMVVGALLALIGLWYGWDAVSETRRYLRFKRLVREHCN